MTGVDGNVDATSAVAAAGTFSIKITVVPLSRIIIITIATVWFQLWFLCRFFVHSFSAFRCSRLFREQLQRWWHTLVKQIRCLAILTELSLCLLKCVFYCQQIVDICFF